MPLRARVSVCAYRHACLSLVSRVGVWRLRRQGRSPYTSIRGRIARPLIAPRQGPRQAPRPAFLVVNWSRWSRLRCGAAGPIVGPGRSARGLFGVFMKRNPVNKFRSAKKFRGSVSKVKAANVLAVQRGGIRL